MGYCSADLPREGEAKHADQEDSLSLEALGTPVGKILFKQCIECINNSQVLDLLWRSADQWKNDLFGGWSLVEALYNWQHVNVYMSILCSNYACLFPPGVYCLYIVKGSSSEGNGPT